MSGKWYWAIGLVVVLGAGAVALARDRGWLAGDGGAAPTATPLPAILADRAVVADARVVPIRSAALSFGTGGTVRAIDVEEGETVEAGQILVKLDSARQAAAVLQAEADLVAAEAALRKLERGADGETLASAEAAVDVARAEAAAAEARIASAQANLTRVAAGSSDDVAIGERQVALAKDALWGAQAQRDTLCGRVDDGFADQAECDGARARVAQAEEQVGIAEIELAQVKDGGRPEDVAAARAQVREAESARAAAAARIKQAEADLAKARRGADEADLSAARAQVDQASARLEQARVTLDDQVLRAPFAGLLGAVHVQRGEVVTPGAPVLQLGDITAWKVETEDLTELDIVDVATGDPVDITFDAIDGLMLPGKVDRIRMFGENRLGDITYRVTIAPSRPDARLRWNMTAQVRIGPAGPAPLTP